MCTERPGKTHKLIPPRIYKYTHALSLSLSPPLSSLIPSSFALKLRIKGSENCRVGEQAAVRGAACCARGHATVRGAACCARGVGGHRLHSSQHLRHHAGLIMPQPGLNFAAAAAPANLRHVVLGVEAGVLLAQLLA